MNPLSPPPLPPPQKKKGGGKGRICTDSTKNAADQNRVSNLLKLSNTLLQHRSRMLRHQLLKFLRPISQRIDIAHARRVRRRRPKLPKLITGQLRIFEHGSLPLGLRRQPIGRRAVFFEDDGLPRRGADGVVFADPSVAPGVVVGPGVWVEVEGAVVDGGDFEVAGEIDAFGAGVGVGAVARVAEPAFVAEGDEVGWVKRFDQGGDFRGPVVDNVGGAGVAARFIG